MASVLFLQRSPEIDALLEHRRGLGLDRYDEMHEGTYVVSPAPHPRHGRTLVRLVRMLAPLVDDAALAFADATNLGDALDYRVPDAVIYQPELESASPYLASASLVVEILSPPENPSAKLAFYRARGVRELLVIDCDAQTAVLHDLTVEGSPVVARSSVLDLDVGTDLSRLWA